MPKSPDIDPLPDPSTMTLAQLCAALEQYEFECEGGPLKNCVEWIALRERVGSPRPAKAKPTA